MLLINHEQIAEAVCGSRRTARRYTYQLPPARTNKRTASFHAAGVIGSLPKHKRKLVPMILAHAVEDGSLYAGPDAIIPAHRFKHWASLDPATDTRWRATYAAFLRVLANDPNCGQFAVWGESLAHRAMLWGPVAVYVVTRDKSNLPDWTRFAPAFSLVNAGGLDSVTLAQVEEDSWT